MRTLRKVIRQLILEKYELDKPLDTSLEDWKGYFEKTEELDGSIKDDFLAAREMADEALELLDGERDNIVAAMEELESKKKEAEAELKAQEEKSKEEGDKVMTLLQRLEKRGNIDEDELEAGRKDHQKYMKYGNKLKEEMRNTQLEYSKWGFENNRMDVVNQVMWFMTKQQEIFPLTKKFAYPQGMNSEIKSRGVFPLVQQERARAALLFFLKKKLEDDFFWQGDFPSAEKLIDRIPPPYHLSMLDK